jgi:hypothetical protein
MARGKSQPARKVIDGVTYYSARAAAEALGRSYRTLTRLESQGVIRRPDPLPGADTKARWYSEADLAELRKLVEQSGFGDRAYGGKGRLRDLLDTTREAQPQRPQKPNWAGEEVSRKPRQFAGRRDEQVETEWTPPSERRQIEERPVAPIPPPVCCPRCGQEVLWIVQDVPGGGIEQRPVCEIHGLVDLSEPEPPDPNRCPSCRREVTWELLEGGTGFVPVCPVHGPVEVHVPEVNPREERPFKHEVDFGGPPPASERPRGLREGDLIGAVRRSRPQPRPKADIMLPHVGPTRPG